MATAVVGDRYRHFKGGVYRVLHIAVDSGTHRDVVVYQGEDSGNVWTRDREEFEGHHGANKAERFARL